MQENFRIAYESTLKRGSRDSIQCINKEVP